MKIKSQDQQFIYANVLEYFKRINTFVFDVDGVFTDNNMLVTESGELLRTMSARDGYAVRYALTQGYHIAIITGGRSKGVEKRFLDLGVTEIYSGVSEKLTIFRQMMKKNNWDAENTLYMGDDIPDWEVMQHVILPCAPADAVPEILDVATYISPFHGGEGCVRDVIEKTMKLRGHWQKMTKIESA